MPRIIFVDTYYDAFLKTLTLGNGTYQEELDKVLARQFGTADFYSREFRKLGWEAIDIIANYEQLQGLWASENGDITARILQQQITSYYPDVVFIQDSSLLKQIDFLRWNAIVVAQCSCELPKNVDLSNVDVVFTSFPHYIPKLKALGVNAVYMPLAFHESVLKPPVVRDIDVSFVGGIGWQWKQGLEVLEAVAREIPTFQWYGYGYEQLKPTSPLRPCYMGQAWGDRMYEIYQRSKIVINRHGEIAENYANNMRMYEATGCGAMLITERRDNLGDLFPSGSVGMYDNAGADDLIYKINTALHSDGEWWRDVAAKGQAHTLNNHTYAHRVPKIAEVLTNAMSHA